MENVIVNKIQADVEVNLTPDQWQLYTCSMACSVPASALNNRMNKLFKDGNTPEEIVEGMWNVQGKYAKFGAADTEPCCVIRDVVRTVFGQECF